MKREETLQIFWRSIVSGYLVSQYVPVNSHESHNYLELLIRLDINKSCPKKKKSSVIYL